MAGRKNGRFFKSLNRFFIIYFMHFFVQNVPAPGLGKALPPDDRVSLSHVGKRQTTDPYLEQLINQQTDMLQRHCGNGTKLCLPGETI